MKKVELPDFDDMMKLADKIGRGKTKIMLLEAELEQLLAEITQEVTTNPKYFVNDKPPSNISIKDTYHITGLEESQGDELTRLRYEIAVYTGELKTDETLFKVYQEMINVWRTQSANERGAYLE